MANAFTQWLNLTKPEVGADSNAWGGHLNGDLDTLDGIFNPAGSGTGVGLNIPAATTTTAWTFNMSGVMTGTGSVNLLGMSAVDVKDTTFGIRYASDTTRIVRISAAAVNTGSTRTISMIDADVTIVGATNTQTLTNKTLTAPIINSPTINTATISIATTGIQFLGTTTGTMSLLAAATATGTLLLPGAITTATLATTANIAAAVGIVKIQKFAATGTYTPSTGMVSCVIECVGGGGGGGPQQGTSTNISCGGGGGAAGDYVRHLATAADIGASKAVTIGTGGASASAGGDTSVGALAIAKGGNAGGTSGSNFPGLGGQGTGGSTGTFSNPGASGQGGLFAITTGVGGFSMGGTGGSGPFGSGGIGGRAGPSAFAVGSAALGYGSGGGGGSTNSTTATPAGGVGTAGVVIITEYCSQ